jgi:hypothetical protein
MDPKQQVMSPRGLQRLNRRNRPGRVTDPDTEEKDQGGEQVTIPASALQKLEARLEELEKRDSLRKDEEAAAKDHSRIFRQWNASRDKALTLEDLGRAPPQPPGPGQAIFGQPNFGIPNHKQMRLMINKFDGKETYKGLGSGFREWGERFLRAIEIAQRHCGFFWPEDIKIDCISHYLEGKALSYFNAQYVAWWEQDSTLVHAMNNMYKAFSVQLTMKQAMTLFEQPKDPHKSFAQHLSYLVEVNAAAGGGYGNLVVESIVKYSCPELRDVLLGRYDPYRPDYLCQAEEMAHFAQAVWGDRKPPKALGKEVVNSAEHKKGTWSGKSEKSCTHCRRRGHDVSECRKKKKSASDQGKEFVMAVSQGAAVTTEDAPATIKWILDSGCSRNLVGQLGYLSNAVDTEVSLHLPNGNTIKASKQGEVRMKTKVDGETITLTIKDVLYVPGLTSNLMSYGLLDRKDIRLSYQGKGRYLIRGRDKLAEVKLVDELLTITGTCQANMKMAQVICNVIASQGETVTEPHEDTLYGFHLRLGHLHYDAIERLANQPGSDIKLTDNKRRNCLICAEGKQTKNPQSQKDSGTNAPTDRIGGVICSDLKGPITPVDRLKNRYVVNFIDYKTNYCRVFLAKTKDVAARQFEAFLAFFERRYDCRIQVLRTDGGGEYANVDLFCQQTGVARQTTEANSPASNGKAERMNRTIFNMARCMILNSGLPTSFWGDAVKYAAYVLNRSPTRSNPKHQSPIQMLDGHAPSLKDIVIFGSPCMVYRPSNKTFNPRATRAIILGRSEETKGFVVYLIKEKKVTTTQHVRNIETLSKTQNLSLLANPDSQRDVVYDADSNAPTEKEDGESEVLIGEEEEKTATSRVTTRSQEQRRPSRKVRENDQVNNVSVVDPISYTAAMKTPKAKEWQNAVNDELDALRQNGTWIAVPKPKGVKILHSKWVFKTKVDSEGKFERYKARLVACGNEQVYGESYSQTFAPVMDIATVRYIFAMGVVWKVPPRHGDVPNAYVRAEGEEGIEIYMYVPKGMTLTAEELKSGGESAILKLLRSLYGLKQAGRLWNALLHARLIEFGFTQCNTDLCLYYKRIGSDIVIVGPMT